ncbi:MAG: hypothetical protein PF693_21500 [Spirochaetia bacterium]|nr:hypothetical protein [Spirochaetia bacterium]
MKIIKKTFIILIFISYFFIFGRQITPEISFIPVWVENLEFIKTNPEVTEDRVIDFKLNGKFGYLDSEGGILFSENFLQGVAIDKTGFISYSRQNDILVLRNTEGLFVNRVDLSGYPVFIQDRRFILSYDNNGISEIDQEGSVLWKKIFSSSISSVSSTDILVLIGTVDGSIRLIDLEGDVIFLEETKTSRINIVYGGAISLNSGNLITVTGIEPQLLNLWKNNGSGYEVDSSWTLDSELRRHAVTGFSEDGLFAYVEADEELIFIELKTNKLFSIPISGRLQYLSSPGASSLVQILGFDDKGYYYIISELGGDILFNTRLSGNNVFFRKDKNKIIIGIDDNLIGYDMVSM